MQPSTLKLGGWSVVTAALAFLALTEAGRPGGEGAVLAVVIAGAVLLEMRAIRPGSYGHLSCLAAPCLAALLRPDLGAVLALGLATLGFGIRLVQTRNVTEGWRDLMVEFTPLCAAAAALIKFPNGTESYLVAAVAYLVLGEVLLRQLYPTDLEAQLVRRRFFLANLVGAVLLSHLLPVQPLAALFVFPLLLIVQHGTYGLAMQLRKSELDELGGKVQDLRKDLSSSKQESRKKSTQLENKERDQELLEELSRFFARNPDQKAIVQGACDAIARLIPSQVLVVFEWEQERFKPRAWTSRSEPLISRMGQEGVTDPVLTDACQHLVLKSVGSGEQGRSRLVRETGAGLVVPIPGYGAVYLGSKDGVELSDRRRNLLITLASQISLGLQSARYRGQLERSLERITEAHAQLQASQAQLVQSSKMAAVGQLAAGVAHELNSPLGAILLQVQAGKMRLEMGKTEKLGRAFEVAEEATVRAQKIIDKLLRFSHRSENSKEKVQVDQLIEQTVSFLQEPFKAEGVEIQASGGKGMTILAEPLEMQQVLTNLLINGRDAARENSDERKPVVTISAAQDVDHIRITVEDSGQGFPPEVKDRLFEPFFTTKQIGEGTGLGLSVSHQIVNDHEGQLEAENGPRGARFTVVLKTA